MKSGEPKDHEMFVRSAERASLKKVLSLAVDLALSAA
jgi:hypothetical protein